MKKTDFPVKCSGCRLANRDRMRRELEGIAPDSDDEKLAQMKKFGGASSKSTIAKQAFKDIWENLESNFPCLN